MREKPEIRRPLDQRILDSYESMPRQEKKLADILLERRLEFYSYSSAELADMAAVSPATAARLFRRLGYANYEEAKRMNRDTRQWGGPLEILETSTTGRADPNLAEHLANDQRNLLNTFERIDVAVVEGALDAIENSRTVWVMGMRASYGLALYARFILNMLKDDVRMLPVGGLTVAEEVANMMAGDVLFVIGFRRRPEQVEIIQKLAREIGVKVILITDLSAVDLARHADLIFRCHARGVRSFDNYAAAVSFLNYLMTRLELRLGDVADKKLRTIEQFHSKLSELSRH